MISLTVAKKYARALLEIGLKERNYESLGKDLEKMVGLLREAKELRAVLFSSIYPAPVRKAILLKTNESLGLSKSVLDFINLLIDRNRMDHFFEIGRSYESLCDAASNRIRATLVSAMDLSPQITGEVKSQLQSTTGKEVILSMEKDPSLIGGVMAKIGNVIYDGTLKTQLLKFRENLYKE